MNAPWFSPTGVLDPAKHARFIANRANLAKDAGIPEHLLWKPLPALTAGEKTWLAKFRQHRNTGYCGLLLTGAEPAIDPLSRIGAMAGCLSRNFVRARVFSLLDALTILSEGGEIVATCLLIPDFVADKKNDKQMPAWRVQQLTALLTDRWSGTNLQTVVYATS